MQDIGLFAVTESQCTEDEHDDEDDSKFRNLALKQSPRSYLLPDNLGWVRFNQKKYLTAIGTFQNALALNSSGADAIDGIVSAAAAEGDEALAETWTYRKAQIQNKDANEKAIDRLREAVRLNPEQFTDVDHLALAYFRAGKFEEMRFLLADAITRFPAVEDHQTLSRLLTRYPIFFRRRTAYPLRVRHSYRSKRRH